VGDFSKSTTFFKKAALSNFIVLLSREVWGICAERLPEKAKSVKNKENKIVIRLIGK
jgi:hypothetical protein